MKEQIIEEMKDTRECSEYLSAVEEYEMLQKLLYKAITRKSSTWETLQSKFMDLLDAEEKQAA